MIVCEQTLVKLVSLVLRHLHGRNRKKLFVERVVSDRGVYFSLRSFSRTFFEQCAQQRRHCHRISIDSHPSRSLTLDLASLTLPLAVCTRHTSI